MAIPSTSRTSARELGLPTVLLVGGILLGLVAIVTRQVGVSQYESGDTQAGYDTLQAAYVLGLLSAPAILLGIAWSLPRIPSVRNLALAGTAVAIIGTALFATNYPDHINVQGSGQADNTAVVVYVYAAGIALLLVGHFVGTHTVQRDYVPRVSPPTHPAPVPFRGQTLKLIDVEGIGPTYAAKLSAVGINDTRQLLAADVDDVSRRTGISTALLLNWQSQADLDRLTSIDNQYAELLMRAGVLSLHQVGAETPENLVRRVDAYLSTVDRKPTDRPVDTARARTWIEEARGLILDTMVSRHVLPRGDGWVRPPPAPKPARVQLGGQVVDVLDIEGIGNTYGAKLRSVGVKTNHDLILADPEDLSRRTEIPFALIVNWQSMGDLDRLTSLNNQHAELLVRSGVLSVNQLAYEEPSVVVQRVRAYRASVERPPTTLPVDVSLVERWAKEARSLSIPAISAYRFALPRPDVPSAGPGSPPGGEEATVRVGVAGPGIDIIEVEGIGKEYAGRLYPFGIRYMHQLRAQDPAHLANQAGVSERLVRTWQGMADLDKLSGLDNQYAEILWRAGIRNVGELAVEQPDNVVRRVENYLRTVSRPPTRQPVNAELARRWIEEARRNVTPGEN